MEPLPPDILDSSDFTEAAATEAKAWRNLLPPEPWLDVVQKHPKSFGDYARHRLEAGITSAPSVVVRARKAHQQVRPVPVVGIPERIIYRALADEVLEGLGELDRSQNAYARFVGGPMTAAYAGRKTVRIGSINSYVVESDIVAFYEYVDHAQLLAEIELRTSEVVLPRVLTAFLTELQGRPFGLPQLLDPSDELSELYGRIVERELLRRGLQVWRYNDDFRIYVSGYDHAQAAVEALSQEASNVGLVLSQPKTHIIKFINYFWANWAEPETDGDVEFKAELIHATDVYDPTDEEAQAEVAHDFFKRVNGTAETDHVDIRNLDRSQSRELNRAIGILTRLTDPFALGSTANLFEFVPHVGHRLGAYLVDLHAAGHDIAPVWDDLVSRAGQFNAWQRIWIVYVGRACKLLDVEAKRTWVSTQLVDPDPMLRAEATLALAPHPKTINFDYIDRAVRTEPEALLPWYALAARQIPGVNQNRLNALRQSNALFDLVLTRPPRPKRARKRTTSNADGSVPPATASTAGQPAKAGLPASASANAATDSANKPA